MKKIVEHTYGSHIYMKMEINGEIKEIVVYFREGGEVVYKTTADNDEKERKEIIKAFNMLY